MDDLPSSSSAVDSDIEIKEEEETGDESSIATEEEKERQEDFDEVRSSKKMKMPRIALLKKKNKKKKMSYSEYIYKVLKKVHPDISVSSNSIKVVNSLINGVFEEIANQSSLMAKQNGRETITVREIQTAVELILPGELAKRAVSEGNKAVSGLATQEEKPEE